MSNDRRLVAVNVLVEYCESQFAANISMQNESNLDVLQLSNLHKMEMFMHAFEIGNNLDVFENIKAEEPAEPELQQQEYSQKVTAEQEDCVTTPLKMEEKVVSKISEETEDFHDALKDTSFNKGYSKKYKWTSKKIDDFRKGYNNKFEELFDGALKEGLDIEDCFNCRKPTSGETKLPAFEIAWELKQFLKNLKNLLKDIRMSLDDTKIISDLCNLYNLMETKSLCPSSWPLVAASFPIIINRARAQLMELGVSWTGIIGPIISPILNGLTYTAETFRNMATPIFDCILNAFRTMRIGMQALEMAGTSYVDQAKLVGKAGEVFSGVNVRNIQEQVNIAEITKRRLKAVEQSTNQSSATSSAIPEMKVIPDQIPYAENLVSGYNPYSYERAGLDLPPSPVAAEIAKVPVVEQTNAKSPLEAKTKEKAAEQNPKPAERGATAAPSRGVAKVKQVEQDKGQYENSSTQRDGDLPKIDYSAELSKLIYVDLYLQPFIASGEDKGEPFRASIVIVRNENFNKEETITFIKELATAYYAKEINKDIVGCGVSERVTFYEALGRRNDGSLVFVIGGGESTYRSKDDFSAVFKLQNENRKLVKKYKDIYWMAEGYSEVYYKLGTRSFDNDGKIVVAKSDYSYSNENDFFTVSEISKELTYPELKEGLIGTDRQVMVMGQEDDWRASDTDQLTGYPNSWSKYKESDPHKTVYASDYGFSSLEQVKNYLKTGEVVKEFVPLTNNLEREAMALKTQSAEVKALAKPKYTSEVALGGRLQRQPAFLYNRNINVPAVKSGGYIASGANPELTRFNAISNIFRIMENGVLKAKLSVEELFNRLIYTFKSFSRLILEPLYTSSQLISEIKVAFNMWRLIKLVINLIEKGLSVCDSLEDSNAKKLLENLVKEEFEDVEVEFDSDGSEKTIAVVKSKSSNYQSRLVPNDCGEVLVKVNDKQVDLDLIYDKIVNELG